MVVVTDCLVDFPTCRPLSRRLTWMRSWSSIHRQPKKIAPRGAHQPEPARLMMAENVAKVIASTPYFKDGFSFQTGVAASLAANLFLKNTWTSAASRWAGPSAALRPDGGAAQEGQGGQGHRCAGL
ncbi:MAG: citrate lyase subunit alpha [Flavonifractor plautii]